MTMENTLRSLDSNRNKRRSRVVHASLKGPWDPKAPSKDRSATFEIIKDSSLTMPSAEKMNPEPKTFARGAIHIEDCRSNRPETVNERFSAGGATKESAKHPDHNDDTLFFHGEAGLYVVCDGAGELPGGKESSQVAVETLSKDRLLTLEAAPPIYDRPGSPPDIDLVNQVFNAPHGTVLTQEQVEAAMFDGIRLIDQQVRERVHSDSAVRAAAKQYLNKQGLSDADAERYLPVVVGGIGTTGSLLKFWVDKEGQERVTFGNVGDSRVLRIRDGEIQEMTVDHSPLRIILDAGPEDEDGNIIFDDGDPSQTIDINFILQLGVDHKELREAVRAAEKAQAKGETRISLHALRKYLGLLLGGMQLADDKMGWNTKANISSDSVKPADVYLLVTDGFIDNVKKNDDVLTIVEQHWEDPVACAQALQTYASNNSVNPDDPFAKPDDVTVGVVRTSFLL